MKSSKTIVEEYLKQKDWRVKENSNNPFSYGGLNKYALAEVFKDYWLREIYPEYISQAYVDGHIHIHDLGGLTLYCCGYSLNDILLKGVRGVSNIPTSSPAKHFDSALNQISNLLTVFQNEIMGAVALNSFDTLLAPFIKNDKLTYTQVKQSMQNYIYSINSNSRMGAEPVFSNLTFDLTPPNDLINNYVVIGGELQSFTYGSCQQEMDMLNRAFFEIMLHGDSEGKIFAYPIPTYNIHKRFDWNNPNNKLLWELTGKYGTPYFANYLNSDMNPEDSRSMCPMTPDTKVLVRSRENGVRISSINEIYKGSNNHNTFYELWTPEGWAEGKPIQISKTKVYKITLSNGVTVKFGENHLQPVENGEILKASELLVGMYLPFNKTPIATENLGNKELGYAVGAYIGDGSKDNKAIVYSLCSFEKDNETENRLVKFWKSIGFNTKVSYKEGSNVRFVRINGNPYDIISTYVKGYDALTKELTNKTFNSSYDFKEGLIEGFRATDGSRSKKRLYTSSQQLREDMNTLLSTMGRKCLINYKDNRENRLGSNTNYRIDYPERESYGSLYKEDEKYNYYQITNIEEFDYVGDYLYCFEVNNKDNLFMLANGLITHNCRLRLDLKELRKRNGGLFGSGDSTGSIGVVTIDLPRLAYENHENKDAFLKELDKYLSISKDSLEIKRKWLQENIIDRKAIPAYMEYVGTMDNHFSTIGIVGMNEMCKNFFDDESDILTDKGKAFAEEVGEHIRNELVKFQEETGNLYNYEATPAESTSYRLALKDLKDYNDIITQGKGLDCYYTNSCHIPVKSIKTINETFKHQEKLQSQFTGGTVIHSFMQGSITGDQAKSIVKAMFTNYTVPYMSISPISRFCDKHGFIDENTDFCPICKKRLKKYQRITGYLRCIDNFNRGKRAEFEDRIQITGEDI